VLFLARPYADVKMSEIADAAGVVRGLLHHYFGTKRVLYVEVVRATLSLPTVPLPDSTGAPGSASRWSASVDGWMRFVEANQSIWLSAVGAGGLGRDDEVDAIIDEARELVATRALEALGLTPTEVERLLPVARGFGGFAEEVTREWLLRGRIGRDQARAMLLAALPALVTSLDPQA
jgi:AcrR family transcriptional regulator